MNISLTICTPTYNRKHLLEKLYSSLKTQTVKAFEWIIVDDGSTDDTKSLVAKWIKDKNKFNIIYIEKENGGKHTAINRGIDYASGKLFFIVDSDDYLVENAVKKIIEAYGTIKYSSDKYAGIAFNKGFSNGMVVGTTFKGDYIDATSLERKKYNINGDKAEVFYTDILRSYKFPEFEGEKFISEALVWNRIARAGYKLRWYQDIIYICEYIEGGLTKMGNSRFKNSPKGLLLYINEYIKDFNLSLPRRLLQYEHYSNSIYDNKNIKQAAKDLNVSSFAIRFGIILREILNIFKKKG